jgi:hypothetical protein
MLSEPRAKTWRSSRIKTPVLQEKVRRFQGERQAEACQALTEQRQFLGELTGQHDFLHDQLAIAPSTKSPIAQK